jgi:hypothetical protein
MPYEEWGVLIESEMRGRREIVQHVWNRVKGRNLAASCHDVSTDILSFYEELHIHIQSRHRKVLRRPKFIIS